MQNIISFKVKILYFITGLRLGGAETQLLLLAKNVRKLGHDVMVVAMESGGIMAEKFRSESIQVEELSISGVATIWNGYYRFKAIVQNYSPDVIHAHMIHANLFSRIYSMFNCVPKLISTAHNIKEGNKLLMSGYYFTRLIPDWSTNVSQEAFDQYVKQKYFFRQKSVFIPNAVDTNQFYPDQKHTTRLRKEFNIQENAYVFFSAGRLHVQKNHAALLNAFAIVRHKLCYAVLLLAGEGPLEKELRFLCKELSIEEHVKFIGRRNDIPALMNLCDCFVLSSLHEGAPLVINEAIATKTNIVATDCGGTKELLKDIGIIVDVNNISALAQAMIKTSQIPSTNERLDKARTYVINNFSIPTVVNKWIKLYTE
ncbi:glycosyltransferase [Mucilaginibacter robiniae]|uniref:Glycosyltransferase n=1 Tax=Mucilaginibacter robiniae TaxID=2728022 RepID=A0A7L5E578_9SPHI|nr:glycosyltransferase [Mucilaginibacter robiniae]QJD97537.1 glycosyltransferase [Mucilaginibacter robiniae]